MKKIITLMTCLLSTATFAVAAPAPGFSKGSSQLNAIASAWKNNAQPTVSRDNDITMVYGGADISSRPTLVFHTTTA